MAGRAYIGTSGYAYSDWRGRFYPRRLAGREWLAYYARHFSTVELNNPFYRLPPADVFRAWREAVTEPFVFAVKASRYLTHMKKLRDPAGPLRLLLGRARPLGSTLGPVLFQLPAAFHANLPRLDGFLAALGRQRMVPGLRSVLEVRHQSWLEPAVIDRLREAAVALCFADWRDVPVREPITADFVYVRRHGVRAGSYSERELRADARAIRRWMAAGHDVYVYFNNDRHAHAVRNARRLAGLVHPRSAGLHLRVRAPRAAGPQPRDARRRAFRHVA
jgi:uncharacterized protein YecE (DUF72 family)